MTKKDYPQDAFRPEDLLDFIELPVFTKRWKALGLNDDEDLLGLQLLIMAAPKQARTKWMKSPMRLSDISTC